MTGQLSESCWEGLYRSWGTVVFDKIWYENNNWEGKRCADPQSNNSRFPQYGLIFSLPIVLSFNYYLNKHRTLTTYTSINPTCFDL